MKIGLLYAAVICLTSLTRANADDQYSTGWLRKGLTAVIFEISEKGQNSPAQHENATQVNSFIGGYLTGMNGAGIAFGSNDPLAFPPKEWMDPKVVTPQILAYVDREKIPEKTPASVTITSWYLANHPKSDAFQKATAKGLLQKYLKDH